MSTNKKIEARKSINPSSKLKIAIIEDDEPSGKFLGILLRDITPHILRANNGQEAVDLCRKHPDIDIVFMDIKMPIMNGYEATKQIRKFNKELIIIAQTAYGLTGDKEKSLAAGCNAYIPKPIVKDDLMALINSFVKK